MMHATPTPWAAHVTRADGIIVRVEVPDAPDRIAAARAAIRAVPGGVRASVRLLEPHQIHLLDALATRRSGFPLIAGGAGCHVRTRTTP